MNDNILMIPIILSSRRGLVASFFLFFIPLFAGAKRKGLDLMNACQNQKAALTQITPRCQLKYINFAP